MTDDPSLRAVNAAMRESGQITSNFLIAHPTCFCTTSHFHVVTMVMVAEVVMMEKVVVVVMVVMVVIVVMDRTDRKDKIEIRT